MVSGTRVLLQWVMIFVEVGSRAAVPKGSFVRPPDRSLVSSKKRFGGSTFSVKEISCSRGLGANRHLWFVRLSFGLFYCLSI